MCVSLSATLYYRFTIIVYQPRSGSVDLDPDAGARHAIPARGLPGLGLSLDFERYSVEWNICTSFFEIDGGRECFVMQC